MHGLEQALKSIAGLNVLNLRPGYFMENTLSFVDSIRAHGAVISPFAADVKMPLIATADIAETALGRMLALDFSGNRVLELQGAADLSMRDATRLVGQAIGKPELEYRQSSLPEFVAALIAAGVSRNVAGLMQEVVESINSGLVRAEQPRSVSTGTRTTYEDFIRTSFLPFYREA